MTLAELSQALGWAAAAALTVARVACALALARRAGRAALRARSPPRGRGDVSPSPAPR